MVIDRINQALKRLPAWPIYPLGLLPVLWLFWRGATGDLGIEPVQIIEHRLGLWGLWLLLATLCISPLRQHLRLNLLRYRRAFGLMAFYYLLVHLLTWAVLDVQTLDAVLRDIVKRPYITVGMLAFALILPLGLSSTDLAIRTLGVDRWRRLHLLVYPAVLLGALHHVLVAKGWQIEPLLYFTAAVLLVSHRLRRSIPRLRPEG